MKKYDTETALAIAAVAPGIFQQWCTRKLVPYADYKAGKRIWREFTERDLRVIAVFSLAYRLDLPLHVCTHIAQWSARYFSVVVEKKTDPVFVVCNPGKPTRSGGPLFAVRAYWADEEDRPLPDNRSHPIQMAIGNGVVPLLDWPGSIVVNLTQAMEYVDGVLGERAVK